MSCFSCQKKKKEKEETWVVSGYVIRFFGWSSYKTLLLHSGFEVGLVKRLVGRFLFVILLGLACLPLLSNFIQLSISCTQLFSCCRFSFNYKKRRKKITVRPRISLDHVSSYQKCETWRCNTSEYKIHHKTWKLMILNFDPKPTAIHICHI